MKKTGEPAKAFWDSSALVPVCIQESTWQPPSLGAGNSLLDEYLSVAMNSFVMRPTLRDLLSLHWFDLELKSLRACLLESPMRVHT